MEIAIAVGTSGTLAAVLTRTTLAGGSLVGVLAVVAAFLAVGKPILNLAGQIERHSRLWSAYNVLFNELGPVVRDIQVHHELSEASSQIMSDVEKRVDDLTCGDDPHPSRELLSRCLHEAEEEFPDGRFWWPPHEATSASAASVAAP